MESDECMIFEIIAESLIKDLRASISTTKSASENKARKELLTRLLNNDTSLTSKAVSST